MSAAGNLNGAGRVDAAGIITSTAGRAAEIVADAKEYQRDARRLCERAQIWLQRAQGVLEVGGAEDDVAKRARAAAKVLRALWGMIDTIGDKLDEIGCEMPNDAAAALRFVEMTAAPAPAEPPRASVKRLRSAARRSRKAVRS